MSADQYISRKEVNKSYRPRSYVMSPGLLRARAPFRVQNAITGLILAGFSAAVWAYSISAVKQDDFSDVDEEARAMMKGRASVDVAPSPVPGSVSASRELTSDSVLGLGSPGTQAQPRGVLAPILDRAFPNLLDPSRKTLVWGAPPLDNLGRVGRRSSTEERR